MLHTPIGSNDQIFKSTSVISNQRLARVSKRFIWFNTCEYLWKLEHQIGLDWIWETSIVQLVPKSVHLSFILSIYHITYHSLCQSWCIIWAGVGWCCDLVVGTGEPISWRAQSEERRWFGQKGGRGAHSNQSESGIIAAARFLTKLQVPVEQG